MNSTTRTGHVVRHRYDAASRMTATIYPAFTNSFDSTTQNITITGDSIARTYDNMNRLTTVSRVGSTITRTYHKEGTLKTERQLTRNWDNTVVSDFTARWWYDAGNRRTKFFNGTDTLRYTYGANGLLDKLKVQWMTLTGLPQDSFLFRWDGLGRRDSLVYYRPGVYVSLGYDKDSHLRMVCSRHGGSTAVSDHLDQRLWYKDLNADGNVLNLDHWAGGTTNPACGSIPSGASAGALDGLFDYDARHQATRDGIYRYTYDASGNRLTKRSLGNSLIDSLLYLSATSNRVNQRYDATPSLVKTYTDHANGARRQEKPPSGSGNWGLYYYNALGEMVGHRSYVGGIQWIGTQDRCRYDALGRRVLACGETLAGWFGFDGDNVIRSMGGYTNPLWRWANGPGLDDPLVALWQYGNGSYARQYYLTDGRGRHLAFTDSLGNNEMDAPVFNQNGGNQSGTIEASTNFDNSRGEVASAPGLSFYRNRYYDQATGRFTTEDPIDVAGGINLYAYSGNNPGRYTDPFGLEPCDPPGSCLAKFTAVGFTAGLVAGTSVGVGTGGVTLVVTEPTFIAAGTLAGLGAGLAAETRDALAGTAQAVVSKLASWKARLWGWITAGAIAGGGGLSEEQEEIMEGRPAPVEQVDSQKAKKEEKTDKKPEGGS